MLGVQYTGELFAQLRIARQQSQLAQGNKTYGHVGARIDTVCGLVLFCLNAQLYAN